MTAHSEGVDRGSEFVVTLPLGTPSPAASSEPAQAPSTEPLRIVLVEDQEDNAALLRAHLQLAGHEVEVAGDGRAGLESVLRVRPDIAILDIGLPDIDGYELARRIGAELGDAKPRLVALTGYGQAADVDRAFEAGFDAHLTKPLDLDELAAKLHG